MSVTIPDTALGRSDANEPNLPNLIGASPLREDLLTASAHVSKLLLEAPDVMAAMPKVLRELGEAARVDRTAFAITETDEQGARWLLVKSEWTTEFFIGDRSSTVRMAWHERKSDCYCTQLATGRSVYLCHGEGVPRASIASELAKSSVIVPVIVDGEYVAAIGFDDCKETRIFDPAAVSALEIAATLIAAALHREKLVEAVRLERERHVAELAKTNTLLRANLERLANTPDPYHFLGHMLLEATRQLDAAAGCVSLLSAAGDAWNVKAFVYRGELTTPPFATSMAHCELKTAELTTSATWEDNGRKPLYFEVESMQPSPWPGVYDFLRSEGYQSFYKMPLVFGEHTVGVITLSFHHRNPLSSERIELLVALAQQLTLAVGLKRLGMSAKNAAVLAERNRISREIHDGLAQAFTGILMQLGAAEEQVEGSALQETLSKIRDITREGLTEARRSVMALQPTENRAGGLELALRQLAERSTIPGRLHAYFDGPDNGQHNGQGDGQNDGKNAATGLAPECEHALLRIAQEAVSNAQRHAQAQAICISLRNENNAVTLRISDDGCGMDVTVQHNPQGFGLTNMRERALAMGGAWELHSKPGDGTHIHVSLPLRKA